MPKSKVILYCKHRMGRFTGNTYTETRPCKSIDKAKEIVSNHLTVIGAEFQDKGIKVQIK